RVIVGRAGPGLLDLHETHRFPNTPVSLLGTLHWDILALYGGMLTGLRAAGQSGPLPGRPDHRRGGEDAGRRSGCRILRNYWHPAAAVQHQHPAHRDDGVAAASRRLDAAAHSRSTGLLA